MTDPDFSFLGDKSAHSDSAQKSASQRKRNEMQVALLSFAVSMAAVFIVAAILARSSSGNRVADTRPISAKAVKSQQQQQRDMVESLIEEYEFMKQGKAPLRELASKCRQIADGYKELRDKEMYAKFKDIEKRLSGDYEVRGSFGGMGH